MKSDSPSLPATVKRFRWTVLRSECAASATEYAVMLALIALVVIGAVKQISPKVNSMFSTVDDAEFTSGSGTGTGNGTGNGNGGNGNGNGNGRGGL